MWSSVERFELISSSPHLIRGKWNLDVSFYVWRFYLVACVRICCCWLAGSPFSSSRSGWKLELGRNLPKLGSESIDVSSPATNNNGWAWDPRKHEMRVLAAAFFFEILELHPSSQPASRSHLIPFILTKYWTKLTIDYSGKRGKTGDVVI